MLVPSTSRRGLAPAIGAAAAPARPRHQRQGTSLPSPPTPARTRGEMLPPAMGPLPATTALPGSRSWWILSSNTATAYRKPTLKPTQDKGGFEILLDERNNGLHPSKVGKRSVSITFYSSLDCSFECSYYKISCHGPQTYGTSGKLSTYSKEHKLVFPFRELCEIIPY